MIEQKKRYILIYSGWLLAYIIAFSISNNCFSLASIWFFGGFFLGAMVPILIYLSVLIIRRQKPRLITYLIFMIFNFSVNIPMFKNDGNGCNFNQESEIQKELDELNKLFQ